MSRKMIMGDAVKERLAALRRKPFHELKVLKKVDVVAERKWGYKYSLATYVDEINGDKIRVVVQGSKHFLCFGVVLALGFEMSSDGTVCDLAEGDLYDFM